MRKFFFGLGVCAAVVIAAAGLGFYILARSGSALDTASKAYTQDAVVAIAAHWDATELWKRASPRLRQVADYDKMRGLMTSAERALGTLRGLRATEGQSMIAVNTMRTAVSAQYVATASFDRGDARFRVLLVRNGDGWLIEGFHVDWQMPAGGVVGRS